MTGSLLKPLSTVYSIQYKQKCAPNLISGSRRTYKHVFVGPRTGSRTDCCQGAVALLLLIGLPGTHVEGKQEVAACVQRRPSSVEANLTGKERKKLLVLLIC